MYLSVPLYTDRCSILHFVMSTKRYLKIAIWTCIKVPELNDEKKRLY